MNEDQSTVLLTHNVGHRGNVSWNYSLLWPVNTNLCTASPPPRAFVSQNFSKRD